MSGEVSLPDIEVPFSLNAIERDGELYSPKLQAQIDEYGAHEDEMWDAYWTAESDTIEEVYLGRKLADFYLLKNAAKLQSNPKDVLLWTQRFNQAGEELHGQVDPQEVIRVAKKDLQEIEAAQPSSVAAMVYRDLVEGVEVTQNVEVDASLLEPVRTEMFERFSGIAEIIESLPEGPYNSEHVRIVFEAIKNKLAGQNQEWQNWTISNSPNKTMLSVSASSKWIDVPDGRSDVATKQELLGLAMHEIGVHAQRAVNGYSADDKMMAKGLPGYNDFEEGLGILFEYLATGVVPEKSIDRYVDIALATGAVNGIRLSRDSLIALGISRHEARAAARNQPHPEHDATRKSVIAHVNRIFRGGTGMPVRDEQGTIIDQPVYVKDMVYYEGFVKARDFIIEQLKNGVSAKELLDYLLSGKFDATDTLHCQYVASKKQ